MAPKKTSPQKAKASDAKNHHKKQKPTSWLGFMFKWGTVASIWGLIALLVLLAWYGSDLPRITKNADFARKANITVTDQNGTIITRYGDNKGLAVTIADLPDYVPQAVVAIEDRRFYRHHGIDPIGLSRAMVQNLIHRGVHQGGSTITQQLAKNLFLSRERTLKRKIQEAMLALWLEHHLSKDEILSAYLNRVYLGSGAYGIEAAAQRYFSVPANALNLPQSAMIAGLLKAPSHYSPLNNPEAAQQRTKLVLMAMQREGFITPGQAKIAQNYELSPSTPEIKQANTQRYFSDWVIGRLDQLIGASDRDLIVETTLNIDLQTQAEQALIQRLNARAEDNPDTQGAILMMQPNGAVVTMVGGKNYSLSQFNRTTQALRQPGSSFKSFVYLTALEKGWQPDDSILDAPFEDSEYQPENYNDKYHGDVTLTEALAASLNTAAVRLMQETGGPAPTMKTAQKLGVTSKLPRDLSLALGSGALSLQEMVQAYAALANGGYKITPYAITKVTDTNGLVYYERDKRNRARQVIDKDHARQITEMLSHVITEGTGHRAFVPGLEVAGKTGTSQNSRDAWFIGYSDALVSGVWIGNDDNHPMTHISGGNVPALIWHDIMQAGADQYQPIAQFNSFNNGGLSGLLQRILGGGNSTPGTDEEPNSFKLNE